MRNLRLGRVGPWLLLLTALAAGFWRARSGQAQPARVDGGADAGAGQPSTDKACAAPANAIVAENCRAGTDAWQIENYSPPSRFFTDHALEGYASASSVNLGGDIRFYVNTDAHSFDLLVFRSGYYGGKGGRLVTAVRGLPGRVQPDCRHDTASGLTSCSNWLASYSLAVPGDWVSGVYLAKLVRSDLRRENYIAFVVRDDARPAPILYQLSVATYQAYNNYAGKSLYNFNSYDSCLTAAAAARAVKVSFERPLATPTLSYKDSYFGADYPMVYWLESQGYDVGYATDVDTHRWGQPGGRNGLLDHRVFLVVGHDEYWSREMRAAVTAARDARVNLGFFGSNTGYWHIRYEPDPWTGEPDRVIAAYKTTESGGPDPSGEPTGTWRDPLGTNQPENALVGVQYLGDNGSQNFPLRVSAQLAHDRLYRNTGLQNMPPGSYVDIGQNLVGWEWDTVADNGHTPAGLVVLAESPVVGALLTDAGRRTSLGPATAQATRYLAASGALVFASGTNLWSWGLALREPDTRLQQITYNLLADMGVQPATPAASLVLDGAATSAGPAGPPQGLVLAGAASAPAGPDVADIQAVAGDDRVTVRWETQTPASGQVWIKRAAGVMDMTAFSDDDADRLPLVITAAEMPRALRHWLVLGGLQPGRVYYLQVAAIDAARQATFSSELKFQTTAGWSLALAKHELRGPYRAATCWYEANHTPGLVGGLGAVLAVGVGGGWLARGARRRRATHPGGRPI